MKFALIHQEKARHSIGFMTRLLGVSRAGYYAWVKRQGTTTPSQHRRDELSALIRQIDTDKHQTYGFRRMLAELAGRIGRYPDAEVLLRHAIELAPGFKPARFNLATLLYRSGDLPQALIELGHLLEDEPDNPAYLNLMAVALTRTGELDDAVGHFERVLEHQPDQKKIWLSYGHTLKTIGRQTDGVAAYRRATEIDAGFGEAWWSLANLKTVRFDDADIAAMQAALAGDGVAQEDRFHLDFALGKALEDRGEADAAFAHYAAGNALRRTDLDYDADETTRLVDRLIEIATPDFFAARAGQGCDASDPVFVLGMPRAGSTLVEQILSSHSQIEGTSELPDIPTLARHEDDYPLSLPRLTAEQLLRRGEEYLKRTRIQRKTQRPLFIDKLPNNWVHAVFIRLILPNAAPPLIVAATLTVGAAILFELLRRAEGLGR